MKRIKNITAVLIAGLLVAASSCKDKREPGKIYMPDMTYSRAIETYSLLDSNIFTSNEAKIGQEIFYNRTPVPGTVKRGESEYEYTVPNDSAGYVLSATVKNPLAPLSPADSIEASRLFNINCGICHGANGKASGPLAQSGKLGGIRDLTSDMVVNLADGTIFHSITYGKNNMGSYASQLSRKQRWMLVQYVRTLQPKAAGSASMAKASSDSASIAKKK
jgi:mono/diheme cytochrome c family protein